jgi:hypothetical protein
MRMLAFWAAWLAIGAIGAFGWLQDACPPAACSFILVLLQAPAFLVGVVAWLGGGAVVSVCIAVWGRQMPPEGAYCDGRTVQLGDRVRVGNGGVEGTVVYFAVSGQAFRSYMPPSRPIAKQGFIVATDDGESHHYLVSAKHVVLLRRASAA